MLPGVRSSPWGTAPPLPEQPRQGQKDGYAIPEEERKWKQLDEWAANPERQLRSLDPATFVVRLTPMCVRVLQVQS